ncbi:hypothetical protein ACTXT7_017090 [Hymenolepis weldensis]
MSSYSDNKQIYKASSTRVVPQTIVTDPSTQFNPLYFSKVASLLSINGLKTSVHVVLGYFQAGGEAKRLFMRTTIAQITVWAAAIITKQRGTNTHDVETKLDRQDPSVEV